MTAPNVSADRAHIVARACPYQGLVPYTEADADWFFGREEWCGIIGDNLRAYRITVLYGASGCGKSSVLHAGVAHQLRDEARSNVAALGSPRLVPVVFSDWSLDDPLGAVRRAAAMSVRELAPDIGGDDEQRSLAESLGAWPIRIEGPLLLVLDQLEDLFRYHDRPEGTVLVELGDILRSRDATIHFLLSIREDALAYLDRFKGYVPGLLDRLLRLEHLDRDAAREAIMDPLEHWNRMVAPGDEVQAEPALVEAILDEVKAGKVSVGRPGDMAGQATEVGIEAPYLQLVLTRLWDEEHSRWAQQGGGPRLLRLETLDRLGGAERIVRTHLDTALASLSKREQNLAGRTLRYLVTPSGTKTALRVADLADFADVPEEQLDPLVALLAGEPRILREAGDGRYEIYHDALAGPILDWRNRWFDLERRRSFLRSIPPLALAGAALLTVGLFLRWNKGHSFLQNDFGGHLPWGGAFTSLAPVGVALGAVLGLLLALKPGTRGLGAGVLFGAGVAGAATYLAVLQAGSGVVTNMTEVVLGVLGALVGSVLVLAAGVSAGRAAVSVDSAPCVGGALSAIAGAVVMSIAITIPFNRGGHGFPAQKVARAFGEASDPVVTSLAIAVIAVLLLSPWRHVELSAALLTLGCLNALFWIRYIGVPLFEDIGSFGYGGVVGLTGAGLVVLGGYLGLRAARAHSPDLVLTATVPRPRRE